MFQMVEQEREGGGDGAVGEVAATQLAERAADDRLQGDLHAGLQRAAQSHHALAAAGRQQPQHSPMQHIAALHALFEFSTEFCYKQNNIMVNMSLSKYHFFV